MTAKTAIKTESANTAPRRIPLQARAQKRHEQILDITAGLLDEVGFDGLTTILIAKRLNISVGSLYHYFPNKEAILYAMGSRWLNEVALALADIDKQLTDGESIESFTNHAIDRLLLVYRRQHGILHLVQAMFAIPQLHELDEQHDAIMLSRLSKMLKRLGFEAGNNELGRIARAFLETTHAMGLVIVNQKGIRSKRSVDDLKTMIGCLLRSHR